MSLAIIFLFLISCSIFSLNLPELDINPELYKQALINIKNRRINIYTSFKNYEKAIEEINDLLKIDDENSTHYEYVKKEIEFLKKNQDVLNSSKKFQNNLFTESRKQKILDMAYAETDLIEKMKLFKSVLVFESDNAVCKKEIGKIYIEMKKYHTAKKWFKEVGDDEAEKFIKRIEYLENQNVHLMKISMDNDKVVLKDEHIIDEVDNMIKSKNYVDAISLLNREIESRPTNHVLAYRMAEIYFEQQNFTEALKFVERTLLLNSKNINALYMKGEILAKQGKFSAALEIFNRIIKSEQNNSRLYRMASNMIRLLSVSE